jgi:Phage derived protein Gp49-like (DUF891)
MEITLLDSVEIFLSLSHEKEVAKVMRTIALPEEFGNDLGTPHNKHLSDNLLELRV